MAAKATRSSPLDALDLPPLTARSVLGSALLGTTRGLSSRTLTALGSLFGIAPPTGRVALSRMVAAGEVVAEDGRYRVAGRFEHRQARQSASLSPQLESWDGTWDVWIVRSSRANAAERTALRSAMVELRYAEHREGVWMRPANLPTSSATDARQVVERQAELFRATPAEDGAALAATLWDLDAWSEKATALLAGMDHLRPDVDHGADTALAPAFLVLVGVVHHISEDPLLPPDLVPRTWPGLALRAEFSDFEDAWQALLASWRRSLH